MNDKTDMSAAGHLTIFLECIFDKLMGNLETVIHFVTDCRSDTAHETLKCIKKYARVMDGR